MSAKLDTLACVRELLHSQSTMTLATVDDRGRPHATPLFFFPLRDLSLCWLSSSGSRHSLNLRTHPQASVTVYASVDRWEKIRGVQMEGAVGQIVETAERREIMAGYRRRFGLKSALSAVIAQATLYAFRPHWIRYLDNARGFGYKAEIILRS